MPIEPKILAALKANDPTLTILDLSLNKPSKTFSNAVLTKRRKMCANPDRMPYKLPLLNDFDVKELVEALSHNTNLKALNLSGHEITDESAKMLAGITNLTALDLSRSKISDSGAKAFANAASLTSLNLHWNEITIEGANALANNSRLILLDLSFNKLDDAAAKAFATTTTLKELNLGWNKITHKGAKHLAANTSLTLLDLSNNPISDAAAEAFASNTTLRTLMLRRDDLCFSSRRHPHAGLITDSGAEYLLKNNMLTKLDVAWTGISLEWSNKLQAKIKQNHLKIIAKETDQLLQKCIILARDEINQDSHSLWSKLPVELRVYIRKLLADDMAASLEKKPEQIEACMEFIFNNIEELNVLIKQASTQKNYHFKIIENLAQNKFRFFLQESSITPPANNSFEMNLIRHQPK